MIEIHKITSDNVDSIKELYEEFKNQAKSYYKFDTDPLEFDQFKKGIIIEVIKGFYAALEDELIGFLFFVVEDHKAIELNICHITEDYRDEDVELELIERFVEEAKKIENWDVISYPMLGGQANYVSKITHLGFKLIGQAIVRFNLTEMIGPQIISGLKLPVIPEEYSIDTWKSEYLEDVSEVIFESFSTAPDAKFDPRFRSIDGCKKVVTMIVNSIMGDFLPDCTSVLVHEGKAVGICFANLTSTIMGNIPLVGIKESAQGKGLSAHLLKHTLTNVIRSVIDAKLDTLEFNATVETDNFPALKMYRKVGFREDYNYPHAYIERESLLKEG